MKNDTKAIEAKHTPGPWHVSPPTSQNPSRAAVVAMSGFTLIYEAPLTMETEANARLIAAAPDLLAACELRSMLDRFVSLDRVERTLKADIERRCRELGWKGERSCLFADFIRDLARAAIAKAGGEA